MSDHFDVFYDDPPERCGNCGGSRFVRDHAEATIICSLCGLVCTGQHLCHTVDDYARAAFIQKNQSRSSKYYRAYHFFEQLAQWFRTGPSCPLWVAALCDSILRDRTVEQLDSETIKTTCRGIPGARKYAERWIDCRYQILGRRGIANRIAYPDGRELSQLRNEFIKVSRAFDHKLYKRGRRPTRKDNEHGSTHALARHNLVNYHFIIHFLMLRAGCRRRVNAHFFFPLLSTERVLLHLYELWKVICAHLQWDVLSLDVLRDTTYDSDPPPVYEVE